MLVGFIKVNGHSVQEIETAVSPLPTPGKIAASKL